MQLQLRRTRLFWVLLLTGTLVLGPRVYANKVFKVTDRPGNFEAVEKVVTESDKKGKRDPDKNIPKNLEKRAMCGGWIADESVGGVGDHIAKVEGVPGREGEPLGNITSGMANRKQDFNFPDETWGLTTACRPSDGGWPNVESNKMKRPKFLCSHPCERPLGNKKARDLAKFSCGAPLNPPDEPRYTCGGTEGARDKGGLCEHLNTKWLYHLYHKYIANDPDDDRDDENYYKKGVCGDPNSAQMRNEVTNNANNGWRDMGLHYCCTDHRVPKDGNSPYANCLKCEGEQGGGAETGCRQGKSFRATKEKTGQQWGGSRGRPYIAGGAAGRTPKGRNYISYFRFYTSGSYERQAIPGLKKPPKAKGGKEVTQKEDIPVACYGMWLKPFGGTAREYDPKTDKVANQWKSCVISPYESKEQGFRDMGPKMVGRGEYKNERLSKDDEFIQCIDDGGDAKQCDKKHGPIMRNPDFIEEIDPKECKQDPKKCERNKWYPNLGGAISLYNPDKTEKEHGIDWTKVLLNLDVAKQEVQVQLSEEVQLSEGSYIRAFDDTVTNNSDRRTIVEWWQEQETEAHQLFTPPIARLIFPSTWSLGLDVLDPLFIAPTKKEDETLDPLTEPLEVQLEAGEDLLGEIAAYIERSLLLRIEEEPVHVVVPMGSPTEFRAYAQAWKRWIDHRKGADGDGEVPPEAEKIMKKLEEYAEQIDDVRKLRAEVTKYSAEILKHQTTIAQMIGNWLKNNVDEYKAWTRYRKEILGLQGQWQGIQGTYNRMNDQTNQPWCKNDRFSTPIYSLLDPWLPGRPGFQNNLDEIGLDIDGNDNVIIDLTALRPSVRTMKLPVLKPIQLRIDLHSLAPPQENVSNPSFPKNGELPDLPEVPDVLDPESVLSEITQAGNPLTIKTYLPENGDMKKLRKKRDEYAEKLGEAGQVVSAMEKEYDKFWRSILRPLCSDSKAVREECKGMGQGEAAKKRCCITPPRRRDCFKPYNDPLCVHAEMDLMERFTRIGARPAVLLKEDFESKGPGRHEPYETGWMECPKDDWACQLLNGEREYPREGWRIDMPYIKRDLDAIRLEAIEKTLLESEKESKDLFDYTVERNDITRTFDVPQDIDLSAFGKDRYQEEEE